MNRWANFLHAQTFTEVVCESADWLVPDTVALMFDSCVTSQGPQRLARMELIAERVFVAGAAARKTGQDRQETDSGQEPSYGPHVRILSCWACISKAMREVGMHPA